MPTVTVYRNASVVTGGKITAADVVVSDGVISAILKRGASDRFHSDNDKATLNLQNTVSEVDCSGQFIFPGFIDVHVHTREPGFSYKETVYTASRAAAAGGYTAICSMPNLNPVQDRTIAISRQLALIDRYADVDILPFGAITCGENGEKLSAFRALTPKVAAFTDDGHGVQDSELMCKAMLYANRNRRIIAAHCEDKNYLPETPGCLNDGFFAKKHGLTGIPSESEWRQLERDIRLVRETGVAYHMMHVSTKESVKLLRRAKAEGLDITAETAPHYLTLCEDDIVLDRDNPKFSDYLRDENGKWVRRQPLGENEVTNPTFEFYGEGRFKMNPPLRSASDREALIEAIKDGTIDMVATDHAPHSTEEKSRGMISSPFGVVGLETAFPVLYTRLVKTGVITLEKLIKLMHYAPSERFSIGSDIKAGESADFCVYDLENEYIIDPVNFKSKGRFSPFSGDKVSGKCVMTVRKGNVIWKN